VAQGKRLLIYAPQAETAQRIDRMLWTWQATGFVPHCGAQDPLAGETPVLIVSATDAHAACDVLLNLAADTPPAFERFERLLELVTPEEEDRRTARVRYKFYRERGYAIADHDLGADTDGAR
jgi:DNA polymerase-3 subunit chi